MNNRIVNFLRKAFPHFFNAFSFSRYNSGFPDLEGYFTRINNKLLAMSVTKDNLLSFSDYDKYFRDLKDWGFVEEIEIVTKEDHLTLKGTLINSPIRNHNNQKTVIFCHGVTNDRWSLFYPIYLVLQVGYSVLTYDARNHGLSDSSYTTLGKTESLDLEDVVNWANEKTKGSEVILYGFSMGASTILFWIGKFQGLHPEVSLAICDSPFDNFQKRFKTLIRKEKISEEILFSDQIKHKVHGNNSWLEYFIYSTLTRFLKSPFNLLDINPIDSLPTNLRVKLLLLHGEKDSVISPIASLRIWQRIIKDHSNLKNINLYFFKQADHGDVSFFGDMIPGVIRQVKSKKDTKITFSQLLFNALKKSQ